jgi:F0F1-type ATP synthase assembly protein I
VVLGGLGYGFDLWRGTAPWGAFVGLMLGIVVGFYELMKAMWKR